MRNRMKEVGKQMIKNLLHMPRVKNAKLVNPVVLIVIYGSPQPTTEQMFAAWELQTLCTMQTKVAYSRMANRLLEEMGSDTVVFAVDTQVANDS